VTFLEGKEKRTRKGKEGMKQERKDGKR